MINAVIVIAAFTFYTSVAQDLPFRKRFAEMAGISLSVAALSGLIGFVVNHFLHMQM
jgi:VIT1/CCC1 family predicted Fe2+/Mn2+ transporter